MTEIVSHDPEYFSPRGEWLPVTALDKALPDGRRLVVELRESLNHDGWPHSRVDGREVGAFTTFISRDTRPGTPEPHSIGIVTQLGWEQVSLSPEEVTCWEAAAREWRDRPGRAARAATAPDTTTWEVTTLYPARPGTVVDYDNRPVMTVQEVGSWDTEDGPSFHADTEDATLYQIRVRELTPAEAQRWDRRRRAQARDHLDLYKKAEWVDIFGVLTREDLGLPPRD